MFLSLWATIDREFSAEPANPLALLVIDVVPVLRLLDIRYLLPLRLSRHKTKMLLSLDRKSHIPLDLSKDGMFVHTSLRRIGDISWNQPKFTVTLHQQKNRS